MSWVPFTPGGSMLAHLASRKRKTAIRRLMAEAAHMPYRSWEEFEARGYEVVNIPELAAEPERQS